MEIVKKSTKRAINLKNLERGTTGEQVSSDPTESIAQATTSPYFSPKKTRNRQTETKLDTVAITKSPLHKRAIKKNLIKDTKNEKQKDITKALPITAGGIQLHSTEDFVEDSIEKKHMKWEPKNWRQTLENIRQMRSTREAPVDTMGCHKCADANVDEKTQRFHTLVALMLSSQTRDQVTYEAMNRLKDVGLTPERIVEMPEVNLSNLLKPVSFYNTKAKNIKKTAILLIVKYKSDIPPTVEELMQLPGVGPKMAHICMKSAWNVVTGIGVDTHVHRIANRLKWVPKETKEPEKTRIELEKWLPFEQWHEVNELLVGFGQTICTPTAPKCDSCSNADICPSRAVKAIKKKKAK